ncbi:Alpha/Beta hydrolase protein [Calycina marina]|uniref:Alpha/Beta hydrolase protein n=1 Tax=Calycina marina TaxID=1763456 RepID=A0A9P7YYY5_9HELO|nr:Alpha/Beta hydrolase protein [Calycina marina]
MLSILSKTNITLVALYLATALAFPPEHLWPRETTIKITSAELSKVDLFSQYAGAAYCYSNVHNAVGTRLACSAEGGKCPAIEAAGATVLQAFGTHGGTTTEGYLALDTISKLIVIAFQGTQLDSSPRDVLTNTAIIQRRTTLCGTANKHDGCVVHDGFYRSMMDAWANITSVLIAAIHSRPDYKIVATGHSLGGAIAALLAVQLRNYGHIVDLYTYGQPHIGNQDINLYIQSQSPTQGTNVRVTHTNDVVPQLPPHSWQPEWDHYYPEYWITADGTTTTENVNVVIGSLFSASGNEGTKSWFGLYYDLFAGFKAHGKYFALSGCNSSPP